MLNAPFFAAPHRVMLTTGAVQLAAGLLVWAAELLTRLVPGLAPIAWGLPPSWMHAGVMLFGAFPSFIFAFLMTAGPKWTGKRPMQPREFLPAFFLISAGWLAAYALQALAGNGWIGLLAVAAGWALGSTSLLRLLRDPQGPQSHTTVAVLATWVGLAALVTYLVGLASVSATAVAASITIALWGYLTVVFFAVVHRMLPVFSINAIPTLRPRASPRLFIAVIGLLAAHGVLTLAGLPAWRWLADLPAAAILFVLSARWGLRQSLAVRLLATNHIAFLWFGIAMALFGVQSLLLITGTHWGGLAPLHALSIGFFLTKALSMATRVTLGHSGRSPFASPLVWGLFLAVQGAALLRVLAEIGAAGPLLAASVLLALAAFVLWFLRHVRYLIEPRIDGQPG